jgi:hypothetical protein
MTAPIPDDIRAMLLELYDEGEIATWLASPQPLLDVGQTSLSKRALPTASVKSCGPSWMASMSEPIPDDIDPDVLGEAMRIYNMDPSPEDKRWNDTLMLRGLASCSTLLIGSTGRTTTFRKPWRCTNSLIAGTIQLQTFSRS